MANYNTFKTEYDEKEFKRLRKPELAWRGKVFCVVIPECSKDIVAEGTDLNHCVGSYVNKILKGQTYIAFMRKVKKADMSLVTLEIRDGKVVTAKGAYNRGVTDEEKKALGLYVKKLNMELKI